MRVLKFPVAVWEDCDGCFTAKTIDGEAAVAVDATAAGAMAQLKKYLRWRIRQDEWLEAADLEQLEQRDVRIRVRPQYATERSVHPSEYVVTLRVPTIIGRRADRSIVCSVPTIGLHLSSVAEAVMGELTQEALQLQFSGLTPAELARCLPPQRITLHTIHVKAAGTKRSPGVDYLPTLRGSADAMGDRELRRRFGRAWRRDAEIAALVERLSGEKTSLVLVGEPGCGKTSILANAVRQMERAKRESDSTTKAAPRRFWQTSGARLIAGMQYLGQWQERCEELLEELDGIDGTLCVENLLELVRNGGCDPASSLAAFFTPYIENGELQLVGEATPREWEACRKLLPNFAALFQVVVIGPLSPQDAQNVLEDVVADAARNHRVQIDDMVAKRTYQLFRRFLPYQPFPGKTLALLSGIIESKAGSRVRVRDIEHQFQRDTGLPEAILKDDIPLAFDDVLAQLEERIFGQAAACEAVAAVVTRFKAGLNDPARPLGVLLFCGPTGVGKTELAKTLARHLFGATGADTATAMASNERSSNNRLLRLDMSEYSAYGAAERLLTRPDGRPSELIERVRVQPFVVVLLDEIEKASTEVFDMLLGVLDEGRLTDHYGRTTMFRSAVIVMTSNLGAAHGEPLGFGAPSAMYEREVFSAFRPEFFNRIDSVVTFNSLSREAILDITRKELRDVAAREGIRKAHLELAFSDELVNHLANIGFDPSLGARPLQRTVEQLVVTKLARFIVADRGQSARVWIELEAGRVVIRT